MEQFIANYGLTPSQSNAAWSILKDLTTRAVQLEKATEDEMAAARAIADAKQRSQYIRNLKEPINALFPELKQRLEGLLTAAQLSKKRRD